MTTKRWNTGVATVMSTLLSIMLALPASAETALPGTAGAEPATAENRAQDTAARSAAIHRVSRQASSPNEVLVHVEKINGVLVADGSLPGVIELVLTDTYIPEAMAQILPTNHALIQQIQFSESSWGRESEAQISLAVADGVEARAFESDGACDIVLSAPSMPGEIFTIHIVEKTLPLQEEGQKSSVNGIKGAIDKLAKTDVPVESDSWWGAESKKAFPGSKVDMAALARVRDAEIHMARLDVDLFAAQEDGAEEPLPAESPEDPEDLPVMDEPAESEEATEPEEATETEDDTSVEGADPVEEPEVTPEPPAKREIKVFNSAEANKKLSKQMISATSTAAVTASESPAAPEKKEWTGSPLLQPVTIDFRDMDLINAVQILANMADINVIAGTDLVGTVTLNLKNVPLMQAMETALRINGLGIVEEEEIYHIKPYLDVIASKRKTEVVEVFEAKALEITKTLQNVVKGSEYESLISIAANVPANTIIVSGPEAEVAPLVLMAKRLDVGLVTLPMVTLPIKLNYSNPQDMLVPVKGMLTPKIGKVSVDTRARAIVVTDIPIIVEQIRDLVKQLDLPVKQVAIDAMIVDVTLTDAADTGVDWLLSAVKNQSRRDAALDTGVFTGNLQELSLGSDLSIGDAAGLLNFGILTDNIDWRGIIQAEVRNNNSTLLSNPKLITVENKPATITIASEIPYTELTSTDRGGQQTSTEFKPIGTTLEVTPTVTNDNHIIAQIMARESTSSQVVNGVPVEDKREISTTPHMNNGQTIFVGGLRKNNDTVTIRKIPVLGDIPIANFLFRSNQRNETLNELLIFLTCNVVEGEPELTDYQKDRVGEVKDVDVKVSAETALINDTVHPGEMRDPAWKWRKNHRPAKGE